MTVDQHKVSLVKQVRLVFWLESIGGILVGEFCKYQRQENKKKKNPDVSTCYGAG